ncbi:beta-lactamase family protein [bacterium]|nr:beta-lactamase family protein [bacterium]
MNTPATSKMGPTRLELGEVTIANWRTLPYSRWSFHHAREVLPTEEIEAGEKTISLKSMPLDLDDLLFEGLQGQQWTLKRLFSESETSGFIVVQDNNVVLERYFNGLIPSRPHLIFSVSKSVTGILAGILAEKGIIDLGVTAETYIPEVIGSCYENCPIQNILDMSVDTSFTESYLDLDGDYGRYRESTGWNPYTDPANLPDLRSFLATLKPGTGKHGDVFHYVTPNTDFMGWLMERASGKTYATLISEYLWKPMGAERNAYVTVDRLGAARAGGGICATIRDMARIGMIMRDAGQALSKSVIPAWWIKDTLTTGDRDAWVKGSFINLLPEGCYRNYWYQTRNDRGAYFALGIHGQWIYIDPKSKTVIAKVSAQKDPENDLLDQVHLRAFKTICSALD